MRVEDGFQQPPYPQEHPYSVDPVLPSLLKRLLPTSMLPTVEADLVRLGNDLVNDIRPLAPLVQAATLNQYDQWGRRVDTLHTSEGWRRLEESAIKEGYLSIAHKRQFGVHSRVYLFAKTMVMTGDYHVIFCPLSMTDGSARVIELLGTDAMKQELHPRLISQDPAQAYMSGQWMTERPGGSDISRTETIARRVPRIPSDLGEPYLLDGFKWFSSAAEGNMAVALARTGSISDGSRGLSLFLVPTRLSSYPTPLSNGIRMHRLKNKIGTVGVPTAELSLNATRGWLIGPLNGGVKAIVPVLNITRIHSAIHCVGSLQRCLSIARSYATVRTVERGTKVLQNVPMHVASLAGVNLLYRALTHLTFGAVVLLGKVECGAATANEEARLRMLTPTVKAFAAERAPTAMEETMASLGGLGYMEETGIGRLIRDCLVEKIWEGTVNILALDLKRAAREQDAVRHYLDWANEILSNARSCRLPDADMAIAALSTAVTKDVPRALEHLAVNPLLPRPALILFATVTSALYLLEHACWSYTTKEPTSQSDLETFRRWIMDGELEASLKLVERVLKEDGARTEMDTLLVFGVESKL